MSSRPLNGWPALPLSVNIQGHSQLIYVLPSPCAHVHPCLQIRGPHGVPQRSLQHALNSLLSLVFVPTFRSPRFSGSWSVLVERTVPALVKLAEGGEEPASRDWAADVLSTALRECVRHATNRISASPAATIVLLLSVASASMDCDDEGGAVPPSMGVRTFAADEAAALQSAALIVRAAELAESTLAEAAGPLPTAASTASKKRRLRANPEPAGGGGGVLFEAEPAASTSFAPQQKKRKRSAGKPGERADG